MLIVNGGYPRSGTVLVGAIICAVLRLEGRDWERYNPQERRELPDFESKVRTWPDSGAILLIHTHIADANVLSALTVRSDAVVFWNHRDPRDVVVSLRKLHDLPLERALTAVQVYAKVEQVVTQSKLALRLRYEDFAKDPTALVAQVADHMGAALSEDQANQIAQETSVSRHRKIMEDIAQEALPGVRVIPTRARPLREDPETLINDRHIQSGAAGRWRLELTADEQTIVADTLGPFVRDLGYDA
ncbi:MAG: sulfotransferase domain-containing protein [Pseudomonadota bacterium]